MGSRGIHVHIVMRGTLAWGHGRVWPWRVWHRREGPCQSCLVVEWSLDGRHTVRAAALLFSEATAKVYPQRKKDCIAAAEAGRQDHE